MRFFSPPDRSTFSGAVEEALVEADALGLGDACARGTSAVSRPAAANAASQHVVERHAGHLGRVLHGEEQPGLGPLPRRQAEQVDAVEGDRAAEHLVAGLAHEHVRQRATCPSRSGP